MPPEPLHTLPDTEDPVPEQPVFQRLHPGSLVLDLANTLRQALLPLVFGGAAIWQMDFSPWPLALGLILVSSSLLILRWYHFRYALLPGLVVIRQGLINRHLRELPLGRINHAETQDNLITRLLGIRELHLVMEGSGAPDTRLRGLSPAAAEAILDHLELPGRQDAAAGSRPADTDPAAPTPLYAADVSNTLVAGTTAFNLFVLLGAAWLVDQLFRRVPEDQAALQGLRELATRLGEQVSASGVVGLALAATAGLLVLFALNLALAFIRWFRFTLTLDQGELQVVSGFFTRSTVRIRPSRIQALRALGNPLRHWLQLSSISVVAPQQLHGQDGDGGLVTLVPITGNRKIPGWLQTILPGVQQHGLEDKDSSLMPVDRYWQYRAFRQMALVAMAATGAAAVASSPWWLLANLALLPLAWLVAARGYQHTGYLLNDKCLITRTALFNDLRWVIPRQRIQAVLLQADPFQRRRGLVTLDLDVNGLGGRIQIAQIPRADALALQEQLLQSVAKAPRLKPQAPKPPAPAPGQYPGLSADV